MSPSGVLVTRQQLLANRTCCGEIVYLYLRNLTTTEAGVELERNRGHLSAVDGRIDHRPGILFPPKHTLGTGEGS